MQSENMLYKLLRYILQGTIIYLVLRYVPKINMEPAKALLVTLILMIMCFTIEYMTAMYYHNRLLQQQIHAAVHPEAQEAKSKLLEKFNSGDSCPSCKVENFNPSTTAKQAGEQAGEQVCRVVCGKPEGLIGQGQVPKYDDNIDKPSEAQLSNAQAQAQDYVSPQLVQDRKALNDLAQTSEQKMPAVLANDDKYYWNTRFGLLGYDDRYGFGGMFYDEYPFYNRFRNNDLKTSYNTGTAYGEPPTDYQVKIREMSVNKAQKAAETQAHSTGGYESLYQRPSEKSQIRKVSEVNRRIEGDLDDELIYSDYNSIPVGAGYKSSEYEYGYNYLPPEKWATQGIRPPLCVTDARQNVMPLYANGSPVDVKEFHSARKFLQPDNINVDYVSNVLNAGR